MERNSNTLPQGRPSWIGLTPLLVFLFTYLVVSLILNDFYKMPITVAFLVSSVYAFMITPKMGIEEKLQLFSRGAGDSNILVMIWIFILSGAFATSAKEMGAIDSTVQGILGILPPQLILPGLFVAACFISTSIGTSVGTVVALAPIAIGLAEPLGIDRAYMAGIIVGGAFFGDNLSFISDTTIAATRSQGCRMKDKFRTNIKLVLPAAIIALVIYTIRGLALGEPTVEHISSSFWLMLPYLFIIVCATVGMNVVVVLLLGIVCGGICGISTGAVTFWQWIGLLGQGITDMGELIIATLLAGGLLEFIRYNGGFDYLLHGLGKHISNRRGGELTIAFLVFFACLCTANNTIAILTTGSMAKEISQKYGIPPRRSASLLDTFSCFAQGIIPYGAQMLLMANLANISPITIVGSLYYPFLMGAIALLSILFVGRAKKVATSSAE